MSAEPGERSTSRTKKRLIIATGAVLVAAITVVGVLQLRSSGDTADPAGASTPAPPPELTAADVTNQFLDALTHNQAQDAGRLTDDVQAAATQLSEVWRTLQPSSATAGATPVNPPAAATDVDEQFTLTWQLGPGRTWTYPSGLHLTRTAAGWRVRWQPAIVHPRLAAGQSLAVRGGTGQPAVVDRDGTPLVVTTDDGTAPADPAVAPRLTGALGREAGGQGGWYVALIDGAGTEIEVLYGTKTAPQAATLSVPVQKAAQAAVDTQRNPAMLVAIQPSTGDILAVAQNSAAGDSLVAMNGLYPPGSTFKIATAAALIEAGVADTETVVPCPASTRVNSRTIDNAAFALPDGPLRTAFAMSCNTTFAEQGAKLAPEALPTAANQFGLGADFTIPGITTETGDVPVPANGTEQVEDSIGQGRVQVSCFGLALMTATVAAGRALTPRLWRDRPTEVATGYQGPPANVLRSLRTMMRQVVTSGRATALAGYGKVLGKTGTAETGDGTAHGWFTGYRDDLAFAVLVEQAGTSSAAVDVTGRFLATLG
ncbi:penicillin-binding transpeptidase domain-containing protein [Actinophytocola sp.]|uniref:penicillin-binding transpeptidase domain-containing protein n=1 Tax=Actinophytocola sp. TaxID=1872138 RepID=UPI00389B009F